MNFLDYLTFRMQDTEKKLRFLEKYVATLHVKQGMEKMEEKPDENEKETN